MTSKARELSLMKVNGIVLGFLKDGHPDMDSLKPILAAAPGTRITFHNALERSADPLAAIKTLMSFPQINILLVRGCGETLEERAECLGSYANVWQKDGRRVLVNGHHVDEAVKLRELCPFIREFHLGSQVRTPEAPLPPGALDSAKVVAAMKLLGN